jgi:pyruvate dehydrogenase E1 component alpha subunit
MNSGAPSSEESARALGGDAALDLAHPAIDPELAIALYEHMVLARVLDRAPGEEAAVVGAVAAMHDDDWVFPSSRDVVAALWRGMPLSAYAHAVSGTIGDPGKGRNAPTSCPFWKAGRVASASPLGGTHIPQAVGLAWAARMRNAVVASLVLFDDGAVGTGDFHTGLNFAGVTLAPVVALCKNDGRSRRAGGAQVGPGGGIGGVADMAVAYGLEGVRVDGADVVAVWGAVRRARCRALEGNGGSLVEAVLGGPDRVDPVVRMRRYLESVGLWDAGREEHLVGAVRADLARALATAAAAGEEPAGTLFDDVYAEPPWHLLEQRDGEARARRGDGS